MTTQIAVRLPDDLVEYLDATVRAGGGTSRADIVARALARERRREIALREAIMVRDQGGYPDLDGIVDFQAAHPLTLD